MKKSFTATLNLPKSKFPAKLLNQAVRKRDEQLRITECFGKLYVNQESILKDREIFCIHDGPPYANGLPHLGHALNKILKDTINRYWLLHGKRISFIPGWDCHGLPIELKALGDKYNDLSPLEIRQKARSFAGTTAKQQKDIFQSWGVIADWDNSYHTFDINYMRNQIDFFHKLYQMDFIYRDFKPVFWSPSSQTALAEAELEYNPKHVSTAVYVRFKLSNVPDMLSVYVPENTNIFAIIWTTTPWTLVSNEAVCFNENLKYSLINNQSDYYVVASECRDNFSKALNKTYDVICEFPGSVLKTCLYSNLVNKAITQPFLHGNFVTVDKGTGLVHSAPNHGHDDYLVFAKNKLKPNTIVVDKYGNFNENVAIDELINKPVLSTGQNLLLEFLSDDILLKSDYVHSYPYDWRTKLPVITRASKQWFFNTNMIKDAAKKMLDNVKFYPLINAEKNLHNIYQQLENKEFWCISRQRVWGVPIPVLYQNDKPIINDCTISHFKNLLSTNGTDFWWEVPKNQLIPERLLVESNFNLDQIEVSKDILDIWFDSGISWLNVPLKDHVSDIVIEGIDQLTGWFQSSLLTSIAARNIAPYKSVYVHGFITDKNGIKMSKSLGNVIEPSDLITKYGIDIFRWWLICHASHKTTASVTDTVLESCRDELNKMRLIFKFCLGNLNDFIAQKENRNDNDLRFIDKYVLHKLAKFDKEISIQFHDLKFNKISAEVINFVANDVSALYLTTIKDRLYSEMASSAARKSAQFVLWQTMMVLMRTLAPIVPHLIEEVYLSGNFGSEKSYFEMQINSFESCGVVDNLLLDNNLESEFKGILNIRKEILNSFGNNSQNLKVKVQTSQQFFSILSKFGDELLDILQIAEYEFVVSPDFMERDQFKILEAEQSKKLRCERCRKFCCNPEDNSICKRCHEVLTQLNVQGAKNISSVC